MNIYKNLKEIKTLNQLYLKCPKIYIGQFSTKVQNFIFKKKNKVYLTSHEIIIKLMHGRKVYPVYMLSSLATIKNILENNTDYISDTIVIS